jgi:pimeloyl-ACP methyl ester carboxylesterase
MPIVRSGDADIAYETAGHGDPLLMIMGFLADSRMWVLQTPVFSEHFTCITFDNRGVGMSSSPPGPYTTEQMAADAIAVLDDAGIDRAHVLGISMGGAIAQHVALKAPERIRSLTLAATWCHPNAWLERMAELGEQLSTLGPEHAQRAALLWLFTPKLVIHQPEIVNAIEQMALAFDTAGRVREADPRRPLARHARATPADRSADLGARRAPRRDGPAGTRRGHPRVDPRVAVRDARRWSRVLGGERRRVQSSDPGVPAGALRLRPRSA